MRHVFARIRRLFFHFIHKHPLSVVLLLITIWISIATYVPGTWLTGWDTLHPEFRLSLNFSRIIQGVWREEQGLGAVAAHAHMSELPRYIFLTLTSLVFPLSALRYIYILLCFILGPIGMYFFLELVLAEESAQTHAHTIAKYAAFLGGMFYIFNIATLQHFLVPFEMFPTQYAAIPWLFASGYRYIRNSLKSELMLFAILTWIASPMAYAFQLWYVYLAAFTLFLFFLSLTDKSNRTLMRSIILIVVTVCVNAYWILPNLYFLADAARYVPLANSNELFSERMFALNKAYANLPDLFILQGALYDWSKFNGTSFVSLFGSWKAFLDLSVIHAVGYVFFAVIVYGALLSCIKKNRVMMAIIWVGIFAFVCIGNTNPPFSWIFDYIRTHIPVLKEGLRSPYTKFSLTLLFAYTSFWGFAQNIFLKKLPASLRTSYVVCMSALCILSMFPFMTGHLIDESMKQKIPDEYFRMFSWFETKPTNERIALFPLHSFWGWEYYKWGYQGAGFVWFGLPQSVLVRDFDRWNPGNENAYWELAYALYSENPDLLRAIVHKYQIQWIVNDKNIIAPSNPKSLYFDQIQDLIAKSPYITKENQFGNIEIYHINLENPSLNGMFVLRNPKTIAPSYTWNNNDDAFSSYGHYISSDSLAKADVIYPYRSIFTGRNRPDTPFYVTHSNDGTRIISPIKINNLSLSQYDLRANDFSHLLSTDSEIDATNGLIQPDVMLNENSFSVRYDSRRDKYTLHITPGEIAALPQNTCEQSSKGYTSRELLVDGMVRLSSLNASNCVDIVRGNLPHENSYLVLMDVRHIQGLPNLFSVPNLNSKKNEIDRYIPQSPIGMRSVVHAIIPPMEPHGLQYSLHFDSLSIGGEQTINDIGPISVEQFPYELVNSLRLEKKHRSPNSSYVVLPQNFDKGWQAYLINCESDGFVCMMKNAFPFVYGYRLRSHVRVDNWANGWQLPTPVGIPEDSHVRTIFAPDYLEYTGLFITFLTFCICWYFNRNIFVWKINQTHDHVSH